MTLLLEMCFLLLSLWTVSTRAFCDFAPSESLASTFIRNVYVMIHPAAVTPSIAGSGMAPALQIGRMDVPPEIDAEFNEWYNTIYVPNYEKVPGVIRGRRYRAVVGSPTYLTLYEF